MPIIHKDPHPLAGKKAKLTQDFNPPKVGEYDYLVGGTVIIEDWWNRVIGKSWKDCNGNPGTLIYAIRTGFSPYSVPNDDEVVYVKDEAGLGHLIHVIELDQESK